MCKPTSSTQLAAFLFVDSRWHKPHDAVQCHAHGSTFIFLFEFQTEFFSKFLFEFQVVRESNHLTIEGPLYLYMITGPNLYILTLCYSSRIRTDRICVPTWTDRICVPTWTDKICVPTWTQNQMFL